MCLIYVLTNFKICVLILFSAIGDLILKSTYSPTIDPSTPVEVLKNQSRIAVEHNTLAHLTSLTQLPIESILDRILQRVKANGLTPEEIMDK